MTNSEKGTRAMIISAICASTIALVASRNIFPVDTGMIAINVITCLFAYFKMVGGMMFLQGWKVFNRKAVLGMPLFLFIYYIVLGSLLFGLLVTSFEISRSSDFDTSTYLNLITLTISLSVGVIGSLVAWYCGIDHWMAGGSEYDARVEYAQKGYSQDLIKLKITQLREAGIIPPKEENASEFV